MIFNTANQQEAAAAKEYLNSCIRNGWKVDIVRKSGQRSLNQNNYLHLILSAFGMHFGYDLSEAKIVYKQVNASTYEYTKKGRVFYRSSADLTKEEMQKTIDLFMQKSAEQGCPLPLATDQSWLDQIYNQSEREYYK